jgi:hypothetical protein
MDTAKLEGHRNSRQVSGTQGSENKGSSSSRKRVFTFQKRWLHSLPIMEKTLHEDDLKRSSGSAEDEPLEEVRHGENGSESRDVVVCMLCDEIAVNRDLMKVWSRMNCRRGRIENHLMSKHPEFMLLLKHKRETEGELAVQIFLQNMRDGKLSARNEISTNLYSQINTTMGLDLTDANKRTFGVTSALNALDPTLRASMVSGGSVLKDSDFENKRKKLKTVTKTSETLQKSGEDNEAVDIVQNDGSALTAPWVVNGEVNKVIMIIGGDLPFVAETATNLWLLGADVLLTFS